MSDDIREAIMASMKETESEEVETTTSEEETTPVVAQEEEASTAPAPATPAAPAENAPTGGETEAAGKWTQDKAPQSWTPKAREKWNEIPPELRAEIVRREEAAVNGVRQLNERFAPAVQFAQNMAPVFQEAQSVGVDPIQYVGAIVQTEKLLRTGDQKSKFNEILRLADQYGVPLRDIINRSVGEELLTKPQAPQQAPVPPEVARELQEMRAWRERESAQATEREIAIFSKDKEFFNDVRNAMADLIDSGVAKTLDEAYEKACWATPEIRRVMIDRERGAQATNSLKERQQRAAGVGIAPNSSLDVAVDNEEDSIEASVRAAFRAGTGRL